MRNCPKCGSREGYQFHIRVGMEGEWGSEAESTMLDESPRTVKCITCGHRVLRTKAKTQEKRDQKQKVKS